MTAQNSIYGRFLRDTKSFMPSISHEARCEPIPRSALIAADRQINADAERRDGRDATCQGSRGEAFRIAEPLR